MESHPSQSARRMGHPRSVTASATHRFPSAALRAGSHLASARFEMTRVFWADHRAAVGMTECESVAMRGLSRVLSNLLCEYGAFFCQGGDTIQIGAIVLTIKEKYFWLLCPFGVMQIDTIDI